MKIYVKLIPELDINPIWGFTMSKYAVETKLNG